LNFFVRREDFLTGGRRGSRAERIKDLSAISASSCSILLNFFVRREDFLTGDRGESRVP
jgi:hypothetical protein